MRYKIIWFVIAMTFCVNWLSAQTHPHWLDIKGAPVVDVRSLGVRGDGSDDTAALSAAALAYKHLLFPPGTYSIDPSAVFMTDDSSFIGMPGATIVARATTAERYLIGAIGKINVVIRGLKFKSSSDQQTAIGIVSCKNVIVEDCTSEGCGLIYVGSSATHAVNGDNNLSTNAFYNIYSAVDTAAEYCFDITIKDNAIYGADALAPYSAPAIFVSYTERANISGNVMNGTRQGIELWGGNSDPSADGAPSTQRKCSYVTVSNNNAHDIGNGGIWGSMLLGTTIEGNVVTNCRDVGIDFEGSHECVADSNYIASCTNGALATFFLNRNIVFSNNTVYPTAGGSAATIYNTTKSPLNGSVTFTGNSFFNANGSAQALLFSAGVDSLIITNNHLFNTGIYAAGDDALHHSVVISGNHIDWQDVSVGRQAVLVGPFNAYGRCIISDNIIESRTASPGAQGILAIASGPFTTSFNITGNILNGWTEQDIMMAAYSASGTSYVGNISQNLGLSSGIGYYVPYATAAIIIASGNYDINGTISIASRTFTP